MKKTQFLFACMFLSSSLFASTNIKHTFLMPRPVLDDLALEKTGWHEPLELKNKFNKNFHLQKTFFTKHSIKGQDVGKYFGIDGTNQISISNADNVGQIVANDAIDVWDRFLIHNYNPGGGRTQTDAEFYLNPKQEVWALRLDFFGLLHNPIPKTFFKISAPIAYIENNLNTNYTTNTPDTDGEYISQFFNGNNINSGDASNLQEALLYGKIDSTRKNASGLADIDAHFGYRLVENEKKSIYISGLVTIPTGNRPKSNYLFEPIYGNGNHLALGWQVDAKLQLWKEKRHSGCLNFVLKHKYVTDGTERRLIPLNLPSYPFAHYYLAQRVGAAQGTPLFPAANILNQDVTIRPGNSLQAFLDLKFKAENFLIDAGYNLYYKEKENISLKTVWQDNVYAIANADYNVNGGNFDNAAELVRINNNILNLDGAVNPNQLNHKVFASLGYNFSISNHPTHIGFGAAYEFANNNFELEGYQFWVKGSCAF